MYMQTQAHWVSTGVLEQRIAFMLINSVDIVFCECAERLQLASRDSAH